MTRNSKHTALRVKIFNYLHSSLQVSDVCMCVGGGGAVPSFLLLCLLLDSETKEHIKSLKPHL